MTVAVSKNLTEIVSINYLENVVAFKELTVGAGMTETIGISKEQNVSKNKSVNVGNIKKEEQGDNEKSLWERIRMSIFLNP